MEKEQAGWTEASKTASCSPLCNVSLPHEPQIPIVVILFKEMIKGSGQVATGSTQKLHGRAQEAARLPHPSR